MQEIRLSVRGLVEFLLRSGSIDSRFTGFDRALEGARIHRRLQREAGKDYASEVSLRQSFSVEEMTFRLEGRADGIFFAPDGTAVIDEIKTTALPVEHITEDHRPEHWAQGMAYAAIYCLQNSLDHADVRLTYFQTDQEIIVRFVRRFTAQELDAFVRGLLADYLPWARLEADWQVRRTASLAALPFPFAAYRPGQRAMAGEVYRTCKEGGALLCQAPTGIGKTISVLFPALKAMAEGRGEKIFYLTARTTTRQAARDALACMQQACLRSITPTAKDKLCPQPIRECTPEACPYADGYYDRIRPALKDALREQVYTPERILTLAQQHRVCPFEFSLDLALWCDVIIGDYNHLFDPDASLQRFFESGGDYLFLIDEAHNLPGRAREMYSARLRKGQFAEAKKLLGKGKSALHKALTAVNRVFLDWRKQLETRPERTFFDREAPAGLGGALARLNVPLQAWLEDNRSHTAHAALLELFFAVREFLRVLEGYDDRYATRVSCFGREVEAELLCLDPGPSLAARFGRGRAAVLFSATLAPPAYYKDLCGLPDAKAVALPSPFDARRLGLFTAHRLPVRYRDREASLDAICRYLAVMAGARQGGYLAFFPSHSFLRQTLERFCRLYPDVPVLAQQGEMDEAARAEFLAAFAPNPGQTLLGFAVLGGVFGEGVDLAGDRLIGAAIVTVGLPQVNPTQEMLRDYFEQSRGSGFDYAYRFPGMNKVLQAAGRVIRTETDKGVVLLLDERFSFASYARLFPAHWSHCRPCGSPEALEAQLQAFWQDTQDPA